jgi:8-oxo-dGTP diphosphatase
MKYPKIGVAAIITSRDKVLLIRRKGPHGTGTWSTPGGHLEFAEDPQQCAIRETREEVGLQLGRVDFLAITNDIFTGSGKHYITIWMEAAGFSGVPTIAAASEVADIGWFEWDALPSPLFLPLENLISQKSHPSDAILKFRPAGKTA